MRFKSVIPRLLGRGVFALAIAATAILSVISSNPASAQVSPVIITATGGGADSANRIVDDATRAAVDHMNAEKREAAPAGITVSGFTMGRLYRGHHDGYDVDDPTVVKSSPASMRESSLFAAGVLQGRGLTADSRFQLGGFVGVSQLDISLKAQPLAGVDADPGTAENTATFVGSSLNYGVGTMYAALSAFYFAGETELEDTWNGTAFNLPGGVYRREFDTEGYLLMGLVGNTFPMGNSTFAQADVGFRYIDFEADPIVSQLGGLTFQDELSATVVTGSIAIFQNLPAAGGILRPFGRLRLTQDVDYSQTSTSRDRTTGQVTEVLNVDRAATVGTAEAGLSWSKDNFSFSAAGYVEGASDHTMVGGRLSGKILFD